MTLRQSVTLALVVIGLLTIGVSINRFINSLPTLESNIDLGFSDTAKQDDYLALAMWFESRDVDIRREQFLDKVNPKPYDTVILASGNPVTSLQQTQKLMDWVKEEGGHLMIAATGFYFNEEQALQNQVLKELGIEVDYLETDDDIYPFYKPRQNQVDCDGEPHKMAFTDYDSGLDINFINDIHLEDSNDSANAETINEDYNTVLLQYDLGDGLVTVFNHASFLTNAQLACFDHAILVDLLVNQDDQIWIVNDIERDGWFTILKQTAKPALVASSLWVLLLIWHVLVRFGKPVDPISYEQRAFFEHLVAVAHLTLRNKQHDQLVNDLQKQIEHRLHRIYPNMERGERIRLLSSQTKISTDKLLWALSNQPAGKLVDQVRLLKILRKSL